MMRSVALVALLGLAALAGVAAHPGLRADPRPRNLLWDSMSAADKQAAIWASVTSDETSWPWPSAFEVGKILFESMNVTFDTVSDVMPAGRKKYIHSEGYVAKFQFVPNPDSPYSGGFTGQTNGVVRFSFAAEPSSSGIIPASAWKFLRDGIPSGDMFAMHSLTPQTSFNFFNYPFTNHIGNPKDAGIIGKLIAWKFGEASDCIRALGVSNVARYSEDGSSAGGDFASPFQIQLQPQVAFPDDSSNLNNWPSLFAQIPAGTELFKVVAFDAPDSTSAIPLGSLYSTSSIVPSMYGDTQLFFQHQRMDGPNGDLAANPQWADQGLNLEALCGH